ncbi:MAG: hypothetical protein AAGJ56_06760 [Myxococcota bacterium]
MVAQTIETLGSFGRGIYVLVAYPGIPFLAVSAAILAFFARHRLRPRVKDVVLLPLLNAVLAVATQFSAILPLALLEWANPWVWIVAFAVASLIQYLVIDRLLETRFLGTPR